MKKVSVFGSSGFIGRKVAQAIFDNHSDFEVSALVSGRNVHTLALQARLLDVDMAVVSDEAYYKDLKELLAGTEIKVAAGRSGVLEAASLEVDTAVMAIMGVAALEPVARLIETGVESIALANKESLVCGGNLIIDSAKANGVKIIPVDSEHNAIFQILSNNKHLYLDKVTLTASGGPFLNWTTEQMKSASPDDALNHPIWKMGRKISVDSATMVNKALEVIEAHYLFALGADKMDVVVHPESIIHALVSYIDGASFALMSIPDMSIPVLNALYWPHKKETNENKLDIVSLGKLTFIEPDIKRFPALGLGFDIVRSPAAHACGIIFNAANEIAVDAFLNSRISFLEIFDVIRRVMDMISHENIVSIPAIVEFDLLIRNIAREVIEGCQYNSRCSFEVSI